MVEKAEHDLFCIYYDNQEDRSEYLERPATENVTLFNILESRHRKFQWTDSGQQLSTSVMRSYKAGQPIWIQYKQSGFLSILELPHSFNNDLCQSSRPVKYMQDFKSSCVINLEEVKCEENGVLDGNSFLSLYSIVSSPSHLIRGNESVEDVKDRMFATINSRLCDGNSCKKVISPPKPSTSCDNIVESVMIHIYHEGPKGIQSVDLFVTLTNRQSEQKYLQQRYEYRHFWVSENNTETVTLSGNPGYLVGKPLRAGYYDGSELSPSISEDSKALSVFRVQRDGLCDFQNKDLRSVTSKNQESRRNFIQCLSGIQ